MSVNDKWYLAKYEPASYVGSYNWDYKFDNSIEGANLVNRYLIKEDKLFLFLNSENYYLHVVKPIEGHSKIQKLFCERNLQKNGFQDLHYSYIRDEKSYTPYYVSADIRTINYCYKSLTKDDNPFTLDLFDGDNNTVILFSKEEIRKNLIVDIRPFVILKLIKCPLLKHLPSSVLRDRCSPQLKQLLVKNMDL
ncbi:hypothetical protein [Priestia sp. JNUCC 25]